MKKSSKPLFLNQSSLLSLFDTYVASVLFYGCEIWGFQKADLIEKIHLDFCKNVLNVKGCTPNIMIYFELGRYPLVYERTYRMIKYWFKLIKTDNCILHTMYNEIKCSCIYKNNWVFSVKKTFHELGLGYIWDNQDHLVQSTTYYLSLIRQRIFDQALQNLYHQLNAFVKCGILYRHLVEDLHIQQYLVKSIPDIYKACITKLRLSSHILAIETGRYKKISRSNRVCIHCNRGVVEDEYHFVLICVSYKDLRENYIKKYYWNRPSMLKFIQLLTCKNKKILCNLGKYLFRAFKFRSSLI